MRPFWRLCRAWLVVHTRNIERPTMLTHRDGSLSSAPWSPQPPLQKAALHSGRAQPRGSKPAHDRMASTRGRAQTITSMVAHVCGSTTGPRALATREGNWIILVSSLFLFALEKTTQEKPPVEKLTEVSFWAMTSILGTAATRKLSVEGQYTAREIRGIATF